MSTLSYWAVGKVGKMTGICRVCTTVFLSSWGLVGLFLLKYDGLGILLLFFVLLPELSPLCVWAVGKIVGLFTNCFKFLLVCRGALVVLTALWGGGCVVGLVSIIRLGSGILLLVMFKVPMLGVAVGPFINGLVSFLGGRGALVTVPSLCGNGEVGVSYSSL